LEEARQSTRRLLEKAFRNWYYPIRHQHFRGFLCARQALMSQAEMLTS
jgi:formylglycine-generating enzyme required for sulfatase activity